MNTYSRRHRQPRWVDALGCAWPTWGPGRQRSGFLALMDLLAHGDWVEFVEAEAAAVSTGLTVDIARKVIRQARQHGYLEIEGTYCNSSRVETRRLRLLVPRAEHTCDRPVPHAP